MHLLLTIIVGGVAGWLAGKIMNVSNGIILNIILGLVGGWLGSFFLPSTGFWGFVGAVLGAAVLIWVVNLIRGKK